ncbi:MAG: aldehyde dehydrogenase family protein [Desulfobacterales bacterium]|jgi:succinate-semialdehyde dehydrogenase/glutarate-semialdehyde dehydrogenase
MIHTDRFKARLDEIQRLADAIDRHKTNLMEAAAYDAGFPIKITSIEVNLSVDHLRTMDKEIPWIENGQSYGTVATIFPYDAPTVMLARLGGAALLTGNTLRFSLSSQTPRTASVLSEICKPLPSIQPVVGMDNREFGRSCVEDKEVRLFFISGASAVGEVYRRQHQSFDKLFFAGPGGMPAAVVFEDADVTSAASFIARRAFINGGQYCTTLKKAYLHTSLYEEIRNQILDRVQRLNVGDALDPETDIGPIRVERTRNILQNALEKFRPARLLTGSINDETVFPLVLETENTDIPDLELFGPFLLLIPFEDPDEAAMELIKTRYGFLLSFFGTPAEKIKTIFYSHFGMVHDNPDFTFTPLRLPFGGKKASGWILERKGNDWIERDGAFIYSKELATDS